MVGKTDINNISFVLNGLIYKGMHYSFKIIQTVTCMTTLSPSLMLSRTLSKLGIPDLTLSKAGISFTYIALTIFFLSSRLLSNG